MIIAIANHAGGQGKTHVTLNLGYALAARGQRVLLVDMDSQGDLSTSLGVVPEGIRLDAALLNMSLTPTVQRRTFMDGVMLDLIPTDLDMAGAELQLVSVQERERRLLNALATIAPRYDYTLIDCPPSLSVMTQNAFYAASTVLIPAQSQDKGYSAVPNVINSIEIVNVFRKIDPLRVLGLLFTMVEHNNMAKEVIRIARQDHGDLVFATTIPSGVGARYQTRYQAPIGVYDTDHPVTLAYQNLAQEVLSRAEVYAAPVA